MSFAQDAGYTPVPFADLVNALREYVNQEFGTNYTEGTFIGSNHYRFMYFVLQKANQNQTKASEIFLKAQEYIQSTNLRIQRPSVSLPGLIDSFKNNGYIASIKNPAVEDAGTVGVCVDIDDGAEDYPQKRLQICQMLRDYVAAGMVFTGTEEEQITLSNGQELDFKFHLPERIPVLLRLTITSSDNQDLFIPDNEVIRQTVFDNINSRYRLGWDFEPQRYFTLQDAPWAATILLEWSDNAGGDWYPDVFEAEFDDLFTFGLEDIAVVIDPPPPED